MRRTALAWSASVFGDRTELLIPRLQECPNRFIQCQGVGNPWLLYLCVIQAIHQIKMSARPSDRRRQRLALFRRNDPILAVMDQDENDGHIRQVPPLQIEPGNLLAQRGRQRNKQ